AGLAAARDLSQAGLRVTVLEARARVGGRVLTVHDPRAPVPLELGAEFIHGEAPETLTAAEAAGLAVVELPDRHETVIRGRFETRYDFWDAIDKMYRDLARRLAQRGKDFPVSEYLDSSTLPAARRQLLRDFVQGFHAAYPERLSAKALAAEAVDEDTENDQLDKQFRIVNGGDALMKWLRDGLDPDRVEVRLSTVVEAIEWKRRSVTVSCRGGDRAQLSVVGRSAISTLPAAILKTGAVQFRPALPAKQRVLELIETGQVFKIVLRFRQAFWEQPDFLSERRPRARGATNGGGASVNFLHAPGAEVPTWWTAQPVRGPVLTGWVGGVRAETLLSEDPASRLERSLVALSDIMAVPRRELEEQLDAWVSHDWRADPFARGAYSYLGVGGFNAPRALARPVDGTLFFAGEATTADKMGTVAGALASGRRAAREALEALK
ncbi:MAG TPA: NAD(P)/FAD-dependent oxidoreductase, partial [Gemmatimonadales bacterium]|nr:NAD(P)/FAD-dependent oxidoreductase [Gemmatimonadales bacterium]